MTPSVGLIGTMTGFRTGACRGLMAASFFAASTSSIRFIRSSFLILSFSATAEPGNSKFALVGAFVDFANGAMLMLTERCVGADCLGASASLFNRSSFWALSFSAILSPGSWKAGFVSGLFDFGGGGILIGRALGAMPSASRFNRSSFCAFSFATVSLLESWNVGLVGARPFGGGRGVGKETLTGRRFEAR